MAQRWTLVVYRAPTQPSSARVAAWRRLHRLGAVFLGPSVCLVPARPDTQRELEAIATRLVTAGGTFEGHVVEAFADATEACLEERYSAGRDQEYAEIVEQAQRMFAELETESARGKFTYAEVEENEADLAKLRRWLRRIQWRDLFGAGRRAEAEAAVRAAAERLDDFIGTTLATEGTGIAPPLIKGSTEVGSSDTEDPADADD